MPRPLLQPSAACRQPLREPTDPTMRILMLQCFGLCARPFVIPSGLTAEEMLLVCLPQSFQKERRRDVMGKREAPRC